MSILALILVILTVISMALHANLRKWLFNHRAITGQEMLISQCGIAAVICGLWFYSLSDWWENLTPSHENFPIFLTAIIGTTIANAFIQFASVKAVKLGDLTFVAPIMAMTPGLVVIVAFALGEIPSLMGYLGIALIVIGAYTHAREDATIREYFQPLFFLALFHKLSDLLEEERKKRLALRWAYTAAICATVGLIFDGLLGRHGNVALGVTVELTGLTVIYVLISFSKRVRSDEEVLCPLRERIQTYWPAMIGTGIFFGLPFILITTAFRLAPISYIGSSKRLSILLTITIAFWFLDERKNVKRRAVTSIAITAGAVILAFDPTQVVVLDTFDEYLKNAFP